MHREHLDFAKDKRRPRQRNVCFLCFGTKTASIIEQLYVSCVYENSPVVLRPFEENLADLNRSSATSRCQSTLDIISEDAQLEWSAGQSKRQQAGRHQNKQNQTAKYFQNNR
ncbi:MAG: hypothetical protein RH945_06875 [Hyphomonas sp.]